MEVCPPYLPAFCRSSACQGSFGPPVHDDIPDLYRDGRVRNPVPSKLKGKTDARNGNFGVMHIDLTTTNEARERDAAARRTSEGTQLAAKLAQTDHYVPIKRSKFLYRPDHQAALSSPQSTGSHHRTTPLTAAETKAEQARLLTLLKSLHPVLVVDQLCKALAFFGGIPGAQGSSNTSFPLSAEANGTGSLFVGWLAEIFPAPGQGRSGLNTQQPTVKRVRGRPRGSKNVKNKEKTLRKRLALVGRPPQAPEGSCAADGLSDGITADDSWVDVDEPIVVTEEDATGGRQVEDKSTDTADPSAGTHTTACLSAGSGLSGNGGAESASLTPTPRRRGRPKGSKNRPKDATKKVNTAAPDVAPENVESRNIVVKKRKPGPGRPKGSKNRPKGPVIDAQPDTSSLQTAQAAEATEATEAAENQSNAPISGVSQVGQQHASILASARPASTQPLQTSPRQQAVLPPTTSHANPQSSARPCAVESSIVGISKGVKRKRKPSTHHPKTTKAIEIPSTTAQISVHGTADAGLAPASGEFSSSQATDVTSTENSKVQPPPVKRKKVPKSLPPPQQPSPNSENHQPVDSGQAVEVSDGVRMPESMSSMDDYESSTVDADSSTSVPTTMDQINMLANHASPQPNINSQGSTPDLRTSYNQSRASSGGSSSQMSGSRQLPVGPYSMSLAARSSQGMYGHTRPAGGQYGQMPHRQQRHQQYQYQQQQDSGQQANLYARPSAQQQHQGSSGLRQTSSAARQDRDPFNGSVNEEGFHGLTTMSHQPAYRSHILAIASSRDSYSNPARRTSQSSSFHARQVHHVPDESTPAYHEYSDQAFMDMTSLDSSQQAGLGAVGQPTYNLDDVTLHRSASSINPAYNSATDMSHSPDNGISESTLRERMYNTLRRQ
ncbi:hypothetical protein CMUS01_01082 [Colletotrichum musicola]|uniref:DNA binding domain with preference for A/T rich regions-like protein n=1 Tax=Colletotrichum musicola TaxID=2175873 RepID=A0A8H6NXE8_9PEZI|nr:hypothetical protein CMUS01_01082 [Colletotrichum musicola]